MFLLVPAYPGCPGSKAIKRSLLLLLCLTVLTYNLFKGLLWSSPWSSFPLLPIPILKLESYFHSRGIPIPSGNPIPTVISILQPQSISTHWPVLIYCPAEGRGLSWPRCYILRWYASRRWSPIPVMTRPDAE